MLGGCHNHYAYEPQFETKPKSEEKVCHLVNYLVVANTSKVSGYSFDPFSGEPIDDERVCRNLCTMY